MEAILNDQLLSAINLLLIALIGLGIAVIDLKVRKIHREVTPNGGKSTKDIVNSTQKETIEQSDQLTEIINRLAEMRTTQQGMNQELRRLSTVDVDDRRAAAAEIDRLWKAIERKGK